MRRFAPEDIAEVWERLRAGQSLDSLTHKEKMMLVSEYATEVIYSSL